ncbi:MAG: alcohol dehydrogenase catalytic domain-containing protein, partial [Kiritimatiellaeota bacterium]|nr:alcohol dehydrogenase catalytic domain-containing protein [Kiritimatiellota bacterium]
MKALVLHGIGDLRFEAAWPDPVVPEGWACVRVGASGICGSDLPRLMQHGAYKHPLIPGHEFAGTVVEPGLTALPKGRKVAILPQIPCGQCAGCRVGPFHCTNYDFIGSRRDGGFAEYCAVPASNLFPLPDGLPLEAGAFIEPLAVTLHVVRRANLAAGSRVLVLGGGAIGILTAQWARILGGREVVLADIRDESLAIAAECGIEKVFNPLSDAFKAQAAFTHIFEAAGATAALVTAINKAVPRAVL